MESSPLAQFGRILGLSPGMDGPGAKLPSKKEKQAVSSILVRPSLPPSLPSFLFASLLPRQSSLNLTLPHPLSENPDSRRKSYSLGQFLTQQKKGRTVRAHFDLCSLPSLLFSVKSRPSTFLPCSGPSISPLSIWKIAGTGSSTSWPWTGLYQLVSIHQGKQRSDHRLPSHLPRQPREAPSQLHQGEFKDQAPSSLATLKLIHLLFPSRSSL